MIGPRTNKSKTIHDACKKLNRPTMTVYPQAT